MKRFFSILVMMCLIMALVPTSVFAADVGDVQEGYYYIKHVESGRYLEINPDQAQKDGSALRMWYKVEKRQSQVFYLEDTGNGWKIISHPSGKVIEVYNASYNNLASVVQGEYDKTTSERWNIFSNWDGTVSIQNLKSGYWLNSSGTRNGATFVQEKQTYSNSPDKYVLYRLGIDDILKATLNRDIDEQEIEWCDGNKNVLNLTGWNFYNYYPNPGSKYLEAGIYVDAPSVAQIIKIRSTLPHYWEEVKAAVNGEMTEREVQNLLAFLGLDDPLYLHVLWQFRYNKDYDNFVKAANKDRYGNYSGVIVFRAQIVTERGVSSGYNNWIKVVEKVEQTYYMTWAEKNLGNILENKGWNVIFK